MLISTTDNNCNRKLEGNELQCLDDLRWMAASTLKELCRSEQHPHLLVFPHSFEVYGDRIGDQRILNVHGNQLETGNLMGFIGRGNTMVRIQSRFAYDDGCDYFLHYMLQRVFAINLFDLKHQMDEEAIFDFLIYLFPSFLKRAIRQGLYREYRVQYYNDANVRGRIEVSRHIYQNVPFTGKIAYTTREHTPNNAVTQLIRHSIEYIAIHPMARGVLTNDDEIKAVVSMIREATPSYNRSERYKIINANLRPLRHPYFDEYCLLQRLCMQILQHEELKYGRDEKEIYGVLFDGAWLWEEYLNTFLHSVLNHPRNRTGEGRKYLFTNNRGNFYPDFFNREVVLDAKYKGYDDWNTQRADLYQIISYMYVMKLKRGGFIVPVDSGLKPRYLNGYEGILSVYGMNVSYPCDDYEEFCNNIRKEEEKLYNKIKIL